MKLLQDWPFKLWFVMRHSANVWGRKTLANFQSEGFGSEQDFGKFLLVCFFTVYTINRFGYQFFRLKYFEVTAQWQILQIKLQIRLSLHLYTIIIRGFIFEVAVKSMKTAKFVILKSFLYDMNKAGWTNDGKYFLLACISEEGIIKDKMPCG